MNLSKKIGTFVAKVEKTVKATIPMVKGSTILAKAAVSEVYHDMKKAYHDEKVKHNK